MKNVIKEYNNRFFESATKLLLKNNKSISLKGKTLTIDINGKETFASRSGNVWVIKKDFPGHSKGDAVTPFDIFCEYNHKNNPVQAIAELIKLIEKKLPYVRVGTDYFKVKRYEHSNVLIPFSKTEIKEDNGNDAIDYIAKYDQFCMQPNNLDYKQVIRGDYNVYNELFHVPKPFDIETEMEKINWSMVLMKHIFGDQLEMGLDYQKLLWENPMQILPILVLASELRQTGKTTFTNWVEMIYLANLVSVAVKDMTGDFNAHIAEKLITVIEETESESNSLVHKLKMISTAKRLLVNKKNITQYTISFYGKVIVLTNKPDKFLRIDGDEIRFWVRSVPKIEIENHNIEEDLRKEIPYFLYYLQQRAKVDVTKSRMVFTPEELETDALKLVQKESNTALRKDIEEHLDQLMLNNLDTKEFKFIAMDIKNKFFERESNIHLSRVSRTLKVEMKLEQNGKNGRYHSITDESITNSMTGIGNYFTLKNHYYGKSIEEAQNMIEDNNLPF